MRILVCGGRDYTGYHVLKITLEDTFNEVWLENEDEDIVVIQGGACGADFLAKVCVLDEWSYMYEPKVTLLEFPADWKTHGKAAGAIRNQQMIDEGKPDLVLAFPGGRGTADMVSRAKKAGIKVQEVVLNV